ncbi:MAG TPA: hypothetical protein VHL57_12490, partial [Flavobacteriales bacterium]|nr:hypothetical protein [Flavobacteriales bacterium]
MIISRTAFKLHYGQARPALAIWKEIMGIDVGGEKRPMRLLTDLSGANYTLVTELHLRSFMDIGPGTHVWMTNDRIRELYPKFTPLCLDSVSDLFHVEQQIGDPCPVGHIVERMEFHLKYGQAREALAVWKEILGIAKESKEAPPMRLMTDITGPSYTLVMEMHYGSMMD